MEKVQRPERGRRKLTFSLGVKQEGTNGSGEDTVSHGQEMGSVLEEVDLRVACPLSMSCRYAISLVFHLPTDAATVLSSKPRPLSQKQMQKEMERLTKELQLMTSQRNELRDHVIFVTEGKVEDRTYHQPNPLNEKVKLQHRQALSALKRLEGKNTEASEQLSELTKETVLYGGLHSWLLMQHSQLEQKVDLLRQEKKKLWGDWVLLMQHVEDLNVLCKSQEEEDSDVRTHQQQCVLFPLPSSQFPVTEPEQQLVSPAVWGAQGIGEKTSVPAEAEGNRHPGKGLSREAAASLEFSQMRSKTLQPEVEEAAAQDESHLQKELLKEEPPAEPHPQQLLNFRDKFYSSNLDSIVE
ncbi:Disks large homolog 5 [Lemmus lemmus]